MIALGEKLFDYMARRLCPNDIDEGRRQIKAAIKKNLWRARLLAFIDYITSFAGPILIARTILKAYVTQQFSELSPDGLLGVTGSLLVVWRISGKREIQNRKNFFTAGHPYDGYLPASLEKLLIELASGLIPTRRELKAGEQDSGAIRTSTGEILGSLIPKETYSNRYALLLLAPDPKIYGYVWPRRSFSSTISSTIYVALEQDEGELQKAASCVMQAADTLNRTATEYSEIQSKSAQTVDRFGQIANQLTRTHEEQVAATRIAASVSDQLEKNIQSQILTIDIQKQASLSMARIANELQTVGTGHQAKIEDAPVNINTDSNDRWVTGGTREEFEYNLQKLINAFNITDPTKREIYKTIFRVTRREAQKVLSTVGDDFLKNLVPVIEEELTRVLGKPEGPNGGEVEHLVNKLARGKRGRADITQYFLTDNTQ